MVYAYVKWAGVIYLICMHEHEGADIRQITTAHVTYVMYHFRHALLYIDKDSALDYGI